MTPKRRAELCMLVGGALHQQPIFSADEMGEVLESLDAAEARERRLREAVEDMLSGWRYIRARHGDLDGVGWDRAEDSARAALSEVAPDAC